LYRHLMTAEEQLSYTKKLKQAGFSVKFHDVKKRYFNRNLAVLINPSRIEQIDLRPSIRHCDILVARDIAHSICVESHYLDDPNNPCLKSKGIRYESDTFFGLRIYTDTKLDRCGFLGAVRFDHKHTGEVYRFSVWYMADKEQLGLLPK